MRTRLLMALLTLPVLANAAGEGAWQASAMGPVVSQRGMAASSPLLAPGFPTAAGRDDGRRLRYEAGRADARRHGGAALLADPLCGRGRPDRHHARLYQRFRRRAAALYL